MSKKEDLKQQILELTRIYYAEVHGQKKDFVAGKTFINYGGRYFDDNEFFILIDYSFYFWSTAGTWAHIF